MLEQATWKPPDDQARKSACGKAAEVCYRQQQARMVERMRLKVSSVGRVAALLSHPLPPALARVQWPGQWTRPSRVSLLLAPLPTPLSPHQILNSRVNATSKTDSGTLENSLLSSLAVQCSWIKSAREGFTKHHKWQQYDRSWEEMVLWISFFNFALCYQPWAIKSLTSCDSKMLEGM